jgi:hypothetical protein
MQKIFENIIALLIEIIGFLGGLLWAISTDWTYEPVILMSVSFIGIIFYLLKFLRKDNLRPFIDHELIRGSSFEYAPKFVNESPKKDGHFTDIKEDGIYLFEFRIKYKLIIRNNSTLIAFYPKTYFNTKELFYSAQNQYSTPITLETPKTLELELRIERKMTYSESKKVLQKSNPPEIIKDLKIITSYQNEERKHFFTLYSYKDGNCYYKNLKVTNEYTEIKY